MNHDECDFEGCHEPLDDEWQPKSGAKLCKRHAKEFDEIAVSEHPSKFLAFAMKTLEQGRNRIS